MCCVGIHISICVSLPALATSLSHPFGAPTPLPTPAPCTPAAAAQDMLTDACAACVPYCGGYAHWGMLEAAKWMVANELERVMGICREHPGYKLLLVGHSLGAGEEGGQQAGGAGCGRVGAGRWLVTG